MNFYSELDLSPPLKGRLLTEFLRHLGEQSNEPKAARWGGPIRDAGESAAFEHLVHDRLTEVTGRTQELDAEILTMVLDEFQTASGPARIMLRRPVLKLFEEYLATATQQHEAVFVSMTESADDHFEISVAAGLQGLSDQWGEQYLRAIQAIDAPGPRHSNDWVREYDVEISRRLFEKAVAHEEGVSESDDLAFAKACDRALARIAEENKLPLPPDDFSRL